MPAALGTLSGLERLLAAFREERPPPELPAEVWEALRRGRVGLVTNPSAITSGLEAAPGALAAAGARLGALFGPEHGVRGEVPAGRRIDSGRDERLGVPVYSLYGETRRPTPEMLAGLDVMLFDIQDVGARFYTYSTTLSYVMEGAAEAGLPVVVLDRPNPIGGLVAEGPILEPEQATFVGRFPIPIRHALTMGELGRLFHRLGSGGEPAVVRAEGWTRAQYWPDTGLPWVLPSPNIPTPDTALVYPGTCLLEGTNVSEGRGTTLPFEIFGAPWLEAEEFAEALNALELPGCRFRPLFFQPSTSKHSGQTCQGAQLYVTDRAAFRAVTTGVAVLATLHRLRPERLEWRQAHLDRLAGTPGVRQALAAGRAASEIAAEWEPGLREFQEQARDLWLYPENPGSSA